MTIVSGLVLAGVMGVVWLAAVLLNLHKPEDDAGSVSPAWLDEQRRMELSKVEYVGVSWKWPVERAK